MRVISAYPMAIASDVFLVKLRYWLMMGGMAIRKAWGMTTITETLERRKGKGVRRLGLALGHGEDASPHDLRHMRCGVEDERGQNRQVSRQPLVSALQCSPIEHRA